MKRGYFGIGVENLAFGVNLGTLWRSAINLGADFIFTTGKRYKFQASDTVKAFRHIPLFEYQDFDDLYDHLPKDCRIVGIELNDEAQEISRFQHPERSVYLLGAEDNGLSQKAIEKCHSLIKIDTNFCMNVSVTGAIVMYDRKVKTLEKL